MVRSTGFWAEQAAAGSAIRLLWLCSHSGAVDDEMTLSVVSLPLLFYQSDAFAAGSLPFRTILPSRNMGA
jgi:hypothetical protein